MLRLARSAPAALLGGLVGPPGAVRARRRRRLRQRAPPPPPRAAASPDAIATGAPAVSAGEEAEPVYEVDGPFRFAGVRGRRAWFTLDGREPTSGGAGSGVGRKGAGRGSRVV